MRAPVLPNVIGVVYHSATDPLSMKSTYIKNPIFGYLKKDQTIPNLNIKLTRIAEEAFEKLITEWLTIFINFLRNIF